MVEDGYPQAAAIAAATQQPNAEGAKDSQRTQKKDKEQFLWLFFCVLCVLLCPLRSAVAVRGPQDYRLLRIGTCISSGLISRTSSGTPQAKAGSALILKWYMLCIAW